MDKGGYKKRGSPRYELFIVRLYNKINEGEAVECIEEIPLEAREVLSFFSYADIVKPFIAIDIRDGLSRDQASIKYGITPGYAREIGRKFGFLPRKKRLLVTEQTSCKDET